MDYLRTLTDLLPMTPPHPGRNYDKAMDYLEPLVEVGCSSHKIGSTARTCRGTRGTRRLICHRRELGKPRLIFYGHIDVVPAEGWDAFEPRVEEGQLHAPGGADMKGAIVSLLMALESLQTATLSTTFP